MTGNRTGTRDDFRVIFVSACYNAGSNLSELNRSIDEQTDGSWIHVLVDDVSTDGSFDKIGENSDPTRRWIVRNTEKKYALQNIVEQARSWHGFKNAIIATIDGDDQLCNNETVSLLRKAYDDGADVVWTAHRWDTNGVNISRSMPPSINPYSWPWCSSHLRTFRATMLDEISDRNFQGHDGQWFRRGYDAALMLPILSQTRRRLYIPDVCYLYNIDSKSIPAAERDWCERAQLSTVNFVRARGFIR